MGARLKKHCYSKPGRLSRKSAGGDVNSRGLVMSPLRQDPQQGTKSSDRGCTVGASITWLETTMKPIAVTPHAIGNAKLLATSLSAVVRVSL
jgi:hypothetical protein